MKIKRFARSVLLLSLVVGGAAAWADDEPQLPPNLTPAAPATQPAQVSASARQLIDQVGAAYTKLHSLKLAGTIGVELQIEGSAPEKHSADFASSFIAPNKFRHEVKDDVLIGSTGQNLYTFKSADNAYSQADAPKDRVASKDLPKGMSNLLTLQDPSLLLALSKDPGDELLSDVVDARTLEDATIGSVTCNALKLSQKDKSSVTLLFGVQDHLLRQMTMDLTAPYQQRRPDLSKVILTIDYTQSAADAPVPEDSFAWTPPAGAKDSDAMAAAHPIEAGPASDMEGKPAPAFKLEGLDGKSVSSDEFKGKVMVLDLWATWCGPCKASLPHLDKLYKAQKDKGLVVFALDQNEDKADVVDFVKTTGLSVPVLLDVDAKFGKQFHADTEGIPQTVIVGKDGKVKKVLIGFVADTSPEELQKAVDAAMKE